MKEANLSYRKVINDVGKPPTTWEEDKTTFLVRVAYLVVKYNIPNFLFINMDETLLNHLIDASQKGNTRLATPAKEAITYYYSQDKNKTIIKNTIEKLNIDKASKEVLKKLIN